VPYVFGGAEPTQCFDFNRGLLSLGTQLRQNHFVAYVLHDGVPVNFDDETATSDSGSHASYVMVMICNCVPNQEEHNLQVGLQVPCRHTIAMSTTVPIAYTDTGFDRGL